MSPTAARYDRWKAPAEDGQILLWPDAKSFAADARQTHEKLGRAAPAQLQNIPLNEVRRAMRKWVGHEDDHPLIATGHQTELYHPGVWAKDILISIAARKLGGRAIHFAVDTDEPKHLLLRWPGGSVPLTDDPQVGRDAWSGRVAPPTPAHLEYVSQAFGNAASKWRFVPAAVDLLPTLERLSRESKDLPSALAASLHQLDASLGLGYEWMLVSPITSAEPYLLMAHHILAQADRFVADYNGALEEYRRQNRIKNAGRPMPNLRVSADECEVPFWFDSLADGTRLRASVFRSAGAWVLRSKAGEEFVLDPSADGWQCAQRLKSWLAQRALRLAPRALTLTAVLRLLLADNFVHGIGGGQYDQVLDMLIERHLGIEPPAFAVTTATLYFPDAVGEPKVCLPCVVREGHWLKHSILGSEKMRLVHQIDAAPRRSQQRAALFSELHERLAVAWTSAEIRNWERKLRDAEQRAVEERVLFDRELFYAIQSRERLAGLIDAYRERLN